MPFEALRALGEGLAARDATARAAGARRALALHPGYDEAALVLARLRLDGGSFEEAREAAARVTAESPLAREARFLDGVALLGLGRYREADVLYAELASGEATAAALGNRALARLRDSPASGASTLLRQAVEAQPASVDLPFNLGWALLVEGDADAAAFWLRGAVRRDPGDAQGRLLLSWALSASGRPEEAEEQWRAAAALVPSLEPMRKADLARRLERPLPSERGLLLDPTRSADAEASRAHAARGRVAPRRRRPSRRRLGARARGAPRPLRGPPAPAPRPGAPARREMATRRSPSCAWPCGAGTTPPLRREIAELLRSMGRGEEARRLLGES